MERLKISGITVVAAALWFFAGGACFAGPRADRIAALLKQAKQQELMLETGKALQIYTEIIKLKPTAKYYWRRGALNEKLNLLDKALEDYNKAIELGPATASMYRDRGQIYWKLRKTRECLADYDMGMKLDPANGAALRRRAHVLRLEKRYKEAIPDCEKALALSTKRSQDVFLDLGYCYFQTGQYQKSIDTYTKMIEQHPDLSGGYYGRAAVYEKIGKPDLAKRDKQKGIEADGMFDPNAVTGELRR